MLLSAPRARPPAPSASHHQPIPSLPPTHPLPLSFPPCPWVPTGPGRTTPADSMQTKPGRRPPGSGKQLVRGSSGLPGPRSMPAAREGPGLPGNTQRVAVSAAAWQGDLSPSIQSPSFPGCGPLQGLLLQALWSGWTDGRCQNPLFSVLGMGTGLSLVCCLKELRVPFSLVNACTLSTESTSGTGDHLLVPSTNHLAPSSKATALPTTSLLSLESGHSGQGDAQF